IIHTHKNTIAHKGKNDGIGVQRTQPAESGVGIKIERRVGKLQSNQQAYQHSYYCPNDSSPCKHGYYTVVITVLFYCHILFIISCSCLVFSDGSVFKKHRTSRSLIALLLPAPTSQKKCSKKPNSTQKPNGNTNNKTINNRSQ